MKHIIQRRILNWLLFGALALIAASCGSTTDEDDSNSLTDAELRAKIDAEIGELNSCTQVSDCEPVGVPPCGTRYIRKGSDRSELDPLLDELARRIGDVGCPASCACGLLSCEAGRCATKAGDCGAAPAGSMNVCL